VGLDQQELIKSGKPSIKLNHRPYFSIIIPCYNSGATITNLLQSIVDQHIPDDLEVILSDDHSTESYFDKVEPFLDKLSIKMTETEYNFAPGNTREAGVKLAEGEWLCFADHDDEFIPDTLKRIKATINKYEEKYCAVANFLEVDPDTGKTLSEMKRTRNWNHAKFYNLDNLWKKYDIHFKKDLLTHEDIYISSRVNCALKDANNDNPLYIDCFCYKWMSRPTTVSREKYGDYSFLESFFKDYLESTGYAYVEQYQKGNIPIQYATDAAIGVLLLSYFYSESFIFNDPIKYKRENFDYLRDFLIYCKEVLGLTNDYIWGYAASNGAEFYEKQRVSARQAVGIVMPSRTFMQWLDYLHHDIQPRHTMSDSMWKEQKK
jgi:glycosyltransferase involved in cell wall biosynthesis